MDAIEKAIRHAFEKGDAQDRGFREKVYRSAFAALERTMGGREDLSDEAKSLRREGLKRKITEIETEFVPAAAPEAPRAPEPHSEAPIRNGSAAGNEPDFTPRVEREDRPAPRVEREPVERAAPPDDSVPGRPRRSFAMMYLIVTLLAFAAIGIWWTMDSGLLRSSAERDTSVPNPPRALESEDFAADGDDTRPVLRASGDWIEVFTPTDPTTAAAPGGASSEVLQDGNERFMRISGTGDAAVVFDVGQGVLQTLAGKRAIFGIDARAEEGEETEISISCEFGALGDCGRRRYVVGTARSDYLFEVNFPNVTPDSSGSIAIIPDIGGQGRVLEVFGIRAAVAE